MVHLADVDGGDDGGGGERAGAGKPGPDRPGRDGRARNSLARDGRAGAGRGWGDRDDRGEGVISAAIAVLVFAGLGALMWVGFRSVWQEAEANTREKVAEIGR